jgi:pimeloyl-ACP methyl ester carboxylesterase
LIVGANLGTKLPDDLPVLYIWGTLETVVTPSVIDKAKNFIKLYEVVTLEGRGHWLMVEAKDEITDRIANWVDGLTPHSESSARL